MPSPYKSPKNGSSKLRGSHSNNNNNNMSRAKLGDVINFFRLAVFVSAAGILYHSVMRPPACDISINLSSPHEFDLPQQSRNSAAANGKKALQRQAQQKQPNQKTEAPTGENSEDANGIRLARKKFTPCPEESRNLVWFRAGPDTKLYEPLHRAFHSRGYSATRDKTRAHYLWTDQPWQVGSMHNTLKPWQRYNHLYNTRAWDDKDKMAEHMNEYYHSGGIEPLHSFPEAHVLHKTKGREEFLERLSEENGGMDEPWVLKKPMVNRGEGVTILPPRSDKLLELEETLQKGNTEERLVIQKYICDEMTYAGRKFDVRVYWTVSSVDPLIVWYHTEQNYVRVGHAAYDESTLKNSTTKNILTTHTFMAAEIKGTWDEFRESIENHVYSKDSQFRERFAIDGSEPEGVRKTLEAIHEDPFGHVQNQMKTVIGHLVRAFRKKVFHPNAMNMENGFTFHAADMIIDNNLDVFIIEGTDGPGKDEDYDFRIKMHSELFGSMLDLAQEVTATQEAGLPVNVTEMEEKGINGGYEIVYNDGWYMDYRFDRLPATGCLYGGSEETTKKKKNGRLPTREVVPATFTALPKDQSDFKTFWIKERTKVWNEPIARALRHTGWTPVDTPGEAQVVYESQEEFPQYEDFARPWQLVSQFPSQYSFFDGIVEAYNDKVVTEKVVKTACCRALKQGNGPIRVVAYWLVLSVDPLTVLYHDGYLHQMYNPKDENEFVDLTEDGTTKKVWKGSWRAFDHYLQEAHAKLDASGKNPAATAAAALSVDPMTHVRSQMKASMVKLAEGFAEYTREQNQNEENGEKRTFSSYALFMADFRIDEDLNVFAKEVSHNNIKGEDHAEVVAMHDDLYGSAFRLMRHINTTSITEGQYNEDTLAKLQGDYEWVIRPNADDPKTSEPWKFTYDWEHKAKACQPTRFMPYHAAVDTTDEEHDEEQHDVVTAATA